MNITVIEMNRQHLEEVRGIEQRSFISPWSEQLFCQELEAAVALSLVAVLAKTAGRRWRVISAPGS